MTAPKRTPPIPARTTPFVARDDELDTLIGHLAGDASVVLVEGEPGIGKTRLIHEALAVMDRGDRQTLIGHAHPVRDPFPLGPLLEALGDAELPAVTELPPLVGATRALLPERADELPPALARLTDPRAERRRALRALVELMGALAPATLVLEDAHWADDATLDLVSLLAAQRPLGLSVVLSHRPVEAGDTPPLQSLLAALPTDATARMKLRPLSREGVAEMASAILGDGRVSDALASPLARRSGGVPFVLEEDLRFLSSQGLLIETEGIWRHDAIDQASAPRTIASVVVNSAARLSRDARAAVETMAVIESRADARLLGAVADLTDDQVATALPEAVAAGLLQNDDGLVAFRHALAREAIYEAIPGPRRRRLHRAAARALHVLAGDVALGRIADHYARAGDTQEWARCAEAAADIATSLGEDNVAYEYLRDVLNAGAAPERLVELTLKLAQAAPWGVPSVVQEVPRMLAAALDQPDLPTATRGTLRLWLGWYRRAHFETTLSGQQDLRAAVHDLEDRPGEQARALASLAAPIALDTPTSAGFAYLDAARDAARRSGDPAVEAYVAANACWLLMAVGDPDAERALEALPPPGVSAALDRELLRGLVNAANAMLDLGYYSKATRTAERALQLADELHNDRYVPVLQHAHVRARWLTGDRIGLEGEIEQLERHPVPAVLAVDLLRAEQLLAGGSLAEAQELFGRIADRQLRWGELGHAACAAAGVVRAALAREDDAAAIAASERVLGAVAATETWVRAAPIVPFAPLGLVREIIEPYRRGIAGRCCPLGSAALAFAIGRLAEDGGDRPAAIRAFAEARQRYAGLPDARHRALAAEAEARNQIAVGNAAVAGNLLRHALRIHTALEAPWDANRVRHGLRQAGVRTSHRRGRRSYGAALSPREREVARLAASGRTNAQIAQELFISSRTVESHLGAAMRKLDVASRRELAGTTVVGPRADERPLSDGRC